MFKLLIVDDEYVIRKGLAENIYWNDLGFEVCGTAENGYQALSKINESIPNVLLLDIKMPEMNGMDLCKIISTNYPDMKIILLSGYNDFTYAQKAIEYKVSAYLLKPVSQDKLIDEFKKLYCELNKNAEHVLSITPNIKKYPYCFAMEICIEHAYCKKNITGEYIGYIKEYFRTLNCDIEYRNQAIFILIFTTSKIPVKDVEKTAHELHKHIIEKIEKDFTASIGIGRLSNAGDTLSTVNQAAQALQFKFFKGLGTIIHYNMINKKKISAPANSSIIHPAENLINILLKGENDFEIDLEHFFRKHFWEKIWDVSLLVMMCTEVYVLLLSRVNENDLYINCISEDQFFKTLLEARTMEELRNIFKKALMDVWNALRSMLATHPQIVGIKQYVLDNYHNDINLDTLAKIFYMNPSYISSYFKKHTGCTISEYITEIRINAAKKHLRNTNLQIYNIADKVGYSDYRYFCTVFKKICGISPLQYRVNSLAKDDFSSLV